MRKKTQPLAGWPRRVTDAQIQELKAWVPFSHLAKRIGISVSFAQKLRRDAFIYKNPSP